MASAAGRLSLIRPKPDISQRDEATKETTARVSKQSARGSFSPMLSPRLSSSASTIALGFGSARTKPKKKIDESDTEKSNRY